MPVVFHSYRIGPSTMKNRGSPAAFVGERVTSKDAIPPEGRRPSGGTETVTSKPATTNRSRRTNTYPYAARVESPRPVGAWRDVSGANIAAAQADGFQATNGALTRRKAPAATPPKATSVVRTSPRCRCQYQRNR